MMSKERFAMLNEYKMLVKKICPAISARSGIYIFYRSNENLKPCVYIGQAKKLLERTASHFLGRTSHIDKSLYTHGIYSDDNPYGWELSVLCECDINRLDELEQYYIDYYLKAGYVVYNVTGGGQKDKKQDINKRQQTKLKSYKNGKNIANEKAKDYIRTMFTKYLDFTVKPPSNKIKERKFKEFKEYLGGTEQ